MQNRIDKLFAEKKDLLSIYFTAGFPELGDTMQVLDGLQQAGVDFVEIGMPFSDPLADGPVIQLSSLRALNNGITVHKLIEQIRAMRRTVTMPVILMGYINPVMHYDIDAFLADCKAVGVDGLILPDLPFDEYLNEYKEKFDAAGIHYIPLIAPQVSDERIRYIDAHTEGFIYMVASAGITGNIKTSEDYRSQYFNRVKNLGLKNKTMIGFGVKDSAGFKHACSHAHGAIIGTAFVQHIEKNGVAAETIKQFVDMVKA